jgi:hypothetical protein
VLFMVRRWWGMRSLAAEDWEERSERAMSDGVLARELDVSPPSGNEAWGGGDADF